MAEYIERKRAIVDACNALELYPSEYAKLEDALNRTPTADVAPVRHGRWIVCGDGNHVPWMCSHCGKTTAHEYKMMYGNYCPNCGARTDGGAD